MTAFWLFVVITIGPLGLPNVNIHGLYKTQEECMKKKFAYIEDLIIKHKPKPKQVDKCRKVKRDPQRSAQ